MTQKQKNLIGGISLLGLVGLICKVVGVLYRIPLAQMIGAQGMGVYQQVFPSYNLLLTISSAGIPVAISRMVAHYLALNDKRNADRVFKSALVMLTLFGFVATIVLMLFRKELALQKGTEDAALGYLMIAPSLFFVCVMSAFRGQMQGRRRMAPTAVSQLIEQVGKVFIALPVAGYFASFGTTNLQGFSLGAAGALLGTSIAEMFALLYMMIKHFLSKKELQNMVQDESIHPLSYKYLSLQILHVSIPITLGACIVPLAGEIDSFMLVNIMDKYMQEGEALISYGVLTGLVFPLINVPTALAMAMSVNLVPSISAGVAKQDTVHVKNEIASGLRFASLIGFPCSIGLSMLSEPILMSLYFRGGNYNQGQLLLGSQLLSVSALTILLFTFVQATSGILQGLKKQRIPMYTLFLGVLAKIALNYTLVKIPSINIHGAPFASLLCYFVSMVPNLYYVAKYGKVRFDVKDLIVKPLCASGLMALVVFALMAMFGKNSLNNSLTLVVITIIIACITYFVGALLFGAVKKEDLPNKLVRKIKFLQKLK